MQLNTQQIESILQICQQAGAAIMKIYGQDDFNIQVKEDTSPLTAADAAANEIICAGLQALTPEIPIVSEENKDIPFARRQTFELLWLVDPLDGTKEFIKRNGEFTVNIALIENGSPVAGFVYAPVLQEMYWAVKGQGAYLRKNGKTTSLQANSFGMHDEALRVICSRSHINNETQQFIDQLAAPQTVSRGSSLKFLLIAGGQAELYPRIAPTMEWDTGAAQCVLEEAGGEVVEYESGKPLRYNKESLLNPYFVARGRLTDASPD